MTYQLRQPQEKILQYEGGKLAISAVPGSGKTFTLSLLAARLIAGGRVQPEAGQQVLIVTYLNASVDTFKARVRQRLKELDLPLVGFDVRTLHSLGLEIVRTVAGSVEELAVLDEDQSDHFLGRATNDWIDANAQLWRAFLPDESNLQMRTRWRNVTERTARSFIRSAKNQRYGPETIHSKLQEAWAEAEGEERAQDFGTEETQAQNALLYMLNGIYSHYQTILRRQGALDFDDLIWQAVELLEQRPDVVEAFRERWPYVLEDEAQDSVPLQEALLQALTGADGNWVRVGDPNQAITSSFTAAHPRYFNAFLDRPDVTTLPLPHSGRSAPRIMGAANALLQWAVQEHPLPEARRHAFRPQEILPTPPGDAQPNPPDTAHNVRLKVYNHREDEELPAVARLAQRYANSRPEHTLAVLVPTNRVGHALAQRLDLLGADYDNLLRGGSREREVAATIHALMALLANPLDSRALVDGYRALAELDHGGLQTDAALTTELKEEGEPYLVSDYQPGSAPDTERVHTLLRSVRRPEALLFPSEEQSLEAALPAGVASEEDVAYIAAYARFLRHLFELRRLPPDDLVLALGHELFAGAGPQTESHDYDLAIAYELAATIRSWRDLQPGWRLPQLAAQLADVASGRRPLRTAPAGDAGFEPTPGRITLATQHSAKGLEWDAVFLVGIDDFWIPHDLEGPFLGTHDFLSGDPAAEAVARLQQLMKDRLGLHAGRDPTESAHIELICERLRLLYVGVTRARRYLHISRSRYTRYYQRERRTSGSLALGAIHRFLQHSK
ncbi:MAG TPA: ATP-dependent helicase [Candidatus Sulfomarinibacteraceae bacterium]|nr:ATP-dependent helicase [Candidatus Sulfomarinibacteraceae bacterium]